MTVTKRDGRKVEFDKNKIIMAITKAFVEVYHDELPGHTYTLCSRIADSIETCGQDMNVEEIQDKVEDALMDSGEKEVAKKYIRYRHERAIAREKQSKLIRSVRSRIEAKAVENSNANVDEKSFSGREKEASTEVGKAIALDYGGLTEDVAQAHKDMLVYQHDLEKAPYGIHNCLFLDFHRVFTEGFKTRNGDIRPPSSFATACQLMAVAFQCQSQVQFGGVASLHVDYDLAPYVRMSYAKHLRKGMIWVEQIPADEVDVPSSLNIEDNQYITKHPMAHAYAMAMLEEEGKQSTEGLFHNLNTLESRQGSQVPFTSINLGRDTSPEGRLVNKWLLNASIAGIGKYHLTPIFPISIFQYKKGVNAKPGDPNYDLKRLALLSMSRRIYPNWCNCDWSGAHEDVNDIDSNFGTMGCRTLVGYDRHGLGYRRVGRGNNVPVTIILPKLGIEYGICQGKRDKPDLEGFWKAYEDTLKLAEKGLLERYNIIRAQSPKAAPFMYQNGTAVCTDLCNETVEETVKHNTLALGIIGIAEMCQALFGANQVHSQEAYNFALKVVERLYTFAKEASERNDLNFSSYFTPAEGLAGKAARALREQYGVIPDVTSREYLTNSVHCPVWEKISIFKKLELEAPFTKFATGGVIDYVELDSTFVKNLDAVETIIDYAFDVLDMPYIAFNFPIDSCLECGYQGEFNDHCPECGSENIQQLRRVTGYLSTDYRNFNAPKVQETLDRVKHSQYTEPFDGSTTA